MAKRKFDRACTVCGKHYEYCPTCSRFAHMERWHDAYCSQNCKDLYNVTAGYINHWLDPEVEAVRLKELDISYKDKLPHWMQNAIAEMNKIKFIDSDATAQESTEEDVKVDVEEAPPEKSSDEPVAKQEVKHEDPIAETGFKMHKEFKNVSNNTQKYKPNKKKK